MPDLPDPTDDDLPQGAYDALAAEDRRHALVFALKVKAALGEPAEGLDAEKLARRLAEVRRRLRAACFLDGALQPVTPEGVEAFALGVASIAFEAGRTAEAARMKQARREGRKDKKDEAILAELQRAGPLVRSRHPKLKQLQQVIDQAAADALGISRSRVQKARLAHRRT